MQNSKLWWIIDELLIINLLLFFNRDAFAEFDPEIVSKYSEKKMNLICNDYGIELSRVRGVVDNANRILEVILF